MKNHIKKISLIINYLLIIFTIGIKAGNINSINVPSNSFDDPLPVNTVYACGDSGLVIKTTDGGLNWCRLFIPTFNNLTSIYFLTPNAGYVVGYNNTAYSTLDGGLSWIPITPPTSKSWSSVYFLNVNTGCITGESGVILRTITAGSTWTQNHSDSVWLRCMSFKDSAGISFGYAVGDRLTSGSPRILRTTNGGISWSSQSHPANKRLWGVYAYSSNVVYAVGDSGTVLKTVSAGLVWTAVNSDPSIHFKSVSFQSASFGTIVGSLGRISYTTNGGATWGIVSYGPNANTLNSITYKLDTIYYTGFTVGDNSSIYRSTNSGFNWTQQFINCYYSVEPISTKIPDNFSLHQNYPNPFNPSTKIKFDIRKTSFIKVSIYDVKGDLITVLVDEELKAGMYQVTWDASDYSSGVYFVKLATDSFGETPEFTQSRKMLLIK